MNIQQFWPEQVEPFEPTLKLIQDLVRRRQSTFRRFAAIEHTKGIIAPIASYDTVLGQEMFRILAFRVVEECVESVRSTDSAHRKEEIIDAINYLWSILLLDASRFSVEMIAEELRHVVDHQSHFYRGGHFDPWGNMLMSEIGWISFYLSGATGDLLRNRAWMANTQDLYFAGSRELILGVMKCTVILLRCFSTWDEFVRYYLAKDEVLNFRLHSNY